MKKITCFVLLLVLLLCVFVPAHAFVKMEIMPLDNTKCKHLTHIRQGPNTIRYVYQNESVHLKQEVFTSVCFDCGKDSQTVIDSQVVETHTWVLTYSNCDTSTGMHEYIYECACKRNSFKVRCTGIHETEGNFK